MKGNNLINDTINTKIFGKEYGACEELTFEGEYLNRKRNGKGKEYGYNGKLKFEGEYLNGKKWNGIFYIDNKDIIYELKNGKVHRI